MSCIYSTLLFVVSENHRHGTTPILTFDQPLWFKARTIIHSERQESELRTMVLKLGSFHIMMSYTGCIGHLMNSSGLREVLELVYADNTVNHILIGKAYDRAVRGHTLVDTALNAMVVAEAYDLPFHGLEESTTNAELHGNTDDVYPDLKEAADILDALLAGEIIVKDACSKEASRGSTRS